MREGVLQIEQVQSYLNYVVIGILYVYKEKRFFKTLSENIVDYSRIVLSLRDLDALYWHLNQGLLIKLMEWFMIVPRQEILPMLNLRLLYH